MSLRSVNCKVNQIFPASFTFSMETVQASYCMGVLSLSRVAMIPLFKIPLREEEDPEVVKNRLVQKIVKVSLFRHK